MASSAQIYPIETRQQHQSRRLDRAAIAAFPSVSMEPVLTWTENPPRPSALDTTRWPPVFRTYLDVFSLTR